MKIPRTLRNVFTVGGLTALSRVLGLVREMLQARLIGAGVEQSAFVLAFALPNMARKLFGEGALTAAFVPIFKGEVERGEIESARRLARAVMTLLLLILGAGALLGVVGISAALGWDASVGRFSERARLILRLVRILFPYMFFICGAAFGMGVLNALGRFAASAFMPAVLNVVWIFALAGLCFFPGLDATSRISAVCWAILLGGVLQMAFLFRCMAKRGFAPRLSFSGWQSEKVRLVWHNTLVAALGAGAVQINYLLDQVLAQCAAPWAAGVIGFAERLMDLPIGVVGVAFGTVLLPTFAGHFAKGDEQAANQVFADAVRNLMFVLLPAAAGMFILSEEITAVIYEGRAFDAVATLRVARALAVYALGLGFFGYQKAIIPWFQAQGDMRTPLRVTMTTVVVNALLNVLAVVLLPEAWRHVGLAMSTVFCSFIGCAMLTARARRSLGDDFHCLTGLAAVGRSLLPMGLATVGLAIVVVVLRSKLPETGFFAAKSIGGLSILVGAGVVFYLFLAGGQRQLSRLRRRTAPDQLRR